MTRADGTRPEFVFELHACRWAELHWPPDSRSHDGPIIVARQLGTRRRRWDTVILECAGSGLAERAAFGSDRLTSDLLDVIQYAPATWTWYRDALPHPGYPWRYVRESIHEAADRGILESRKVNNRIEIKRIHPYPDWVERVIAIEHKPDLTASAADSLAAQLEYDIAAGIADEVWLATATQDSAVPPALLEAMPVEAGILSIDPSFEAATILWHPRRLDPQSPGTRILERPKSDGFDTSAARFEYIEPAEKAAIRHRIAERAYERGWRSAIDSMRPDCRHFTLAAETMTHEPRCQAKGRPQTAGECSYRCPDFEPEPPAWRQRGWPIEGGPGKGIKALYDRQRQRYR